jgi:hypothetical protein
VQTIEIVSQWGGLSLVRPPISRFTIRNDGGVFRRNGELIDAALVTDFLAALDEPAMPEPTLVSTGITQGWLNAHVDQAFDSFLRLSRGPEYYSAAQKALLRKTFADPVSIQSLLKPFFSRRHTDDYPSIEVVVSFGSGRTKTVTSSSQSGLMLPWWIESNALQSFNAHVSRSVAGLMPRDATNYNRLTDDAFAKELANVVLDSLHDQLNLLDVDTRLPGVLPHIRTKFSVEAAELNELYDVTYGVTWDRSSQERETNLHANLHSAGAPPNLTTALVLRASEGHVEGMETFLMRASRLQNRILSIAWLRRFLIDFPRVPVRIAFIHDRSFGVKALRIFTQDMKSAEKTDLVGEVVARADEAVLLIVGDQYVESYWLVLPDDRMVLWRFRGPASGLLKWKPENFQARSCTEYHDRNDQCVGAVVTANGVLTP